ncbi:hypothetical protein [Nocardioides guangzhouensis]|nr:hypothetical protein [Nocardioides guangzhouensis]
MNMHYELAKTEIATRLHHAESRRSARHARTRQRQDLRPRWQRFRST